MRTGVGAALALATLIGAAGAARAQGGAQVGEIVVTAERRANGMAIVTQPPPYAVVFRRADNLVVEAQVDCDTRDQSDRLTEMKATLRNMIAAASASGEIELGVESDNVIVPLKPEALDTILSPGQREDTTTTTIVVKTHVAQADTFEAASARINGFILKTKVVGRTEVTRTGDWQLTLITPRQYRPQIVAAIGQDANDTLKAFGPGYGVEVAGLEHAVEWSRSGPLDLALYVPYTLKVVPLPAR
ncbi:MAG TPA: hypothetical protein VGG29_16695 [Caulobacteraceae bacterium]